MKIDSFSCLLILASAIGLQSNSFAAGPSARVGDGTNHGGVIVQGAPTVLIGGQPAARVGDFVICPQLTFIDDAPVPHVGGQISSGASSVLIEGRPAASIGDVVNEVGTQSSIIVGATTVIIGTSGGS